MSLYYYSVIIPYSDKRTQWHPTEKGGDFDPLVRGAFDTEALAHGWAAAHLEGQPYSVRAYPAVLTFRDLQARRSRAKDRNDSAEVERCERYARELAAVHQHMHPAFARMIAESIKAGLPQAFTADMWIHDAAELESRPHSDRFAWILYSCGTHLCFDTKHVRAACECSRSGYAADHDIAAAARAYIWDGTRLAPAACDARALELALMD